MKILLKFPTKSRPKQFIETLRLYKETCDKPYNVQVLVSYDSDDKTMSQAVVLEAKKIFDKTVCVIGSPQGKIAACNRDMELVHDWDIVILVSDDMIPQCKGWDSEIISKMPADLDRVLFFNDGYLGKKLNTMCILGRKYYERLGYIYHPSYQSLWADNEFMIVAEKLGKQDYFDLCLFKHEHFSTNQSVKADALMSHNQKFYHADKRNFNYRQSKNFDL
jgi:hypothetical protein